MFFLPFLFLIKMREIVDVEPSSRNEEAQTEYKIEEQALFRIQTAGGLF